MGVQLAGMALNRAIAEAQDYRLIATAHLTYILSKGGKDIRLFYGPISLDDAWERVFAFPYGLPKWSSDTGNAFNLCLEIAEQRGYDLVTYRAKSSAGTVTVAKFFTHEDGKPQVAIAGFAWVFDSTALAQLALWALTVRNAPPLKTLLAVHQVDESMSLRYIPFHENGSIVFPSAE